MTRPDFDSWWFYYRKGAELLEVHPCTLHISRAWAHRNRDGCKVEPGHELVSVRSYFKYCKKNLTIQKNIVK